MPWYEHEVTITGTYKVWNEARNEAEAIQGVKVMVGQNIKDNTVLSESLKTIYSIIVDSTKEQTNYSPRNIG